MSRRRLSRCAVLLVVQLALLALLGCTMLLRLGGSNCPPAAAASHSGPVDAGAAASSSWRRRSAADFAARDALLAAWPAARPRAAFLVLALNAEADGVASSMRELAARWPRGADDPQGYPWLFLNDAPWTAAAKATLRKATRCPVLFGEVPPEHWSYPPGLDMVCRWLGHRGR